MPRYPHTKLFNYSSRIVVLSGSHIQVLDTQCILYSTRNTPWEDEIALMNGPIRCSGVSKDGRYLATTGNDKQLSIWDLEPLILLSSQELAKKPTSIEFTRNADILVSDKFGDVFRWTIPASNPGFASNENPSTGGELILGHASLLTSCLLTPDERFIITADRDEHIRVSWYPEGYVIQAYCLGHTKYVSAIHIPVASPDCLISGGGDHELKVWDWMTGRLLRNIPVFHAVAPFIKVTTRKGAVFAVHRIGSFLSGNEIHVVFSVVGATAIFEFVLAETDDEPIVRHRDFGQPVIDFTLCEDGLIWVLLDPDFQEETDASDEHSRRLVEAIRWADDQGFVDAGNSEVLDMLDTICCIPASTDDLKALDLYADLSSLPKSIDGEQGSRASEQIMSTHELVVDEFAEEGTSNPTGLTKRALGRLKHKRALHRLHHEKTDGNDIAGPDPEG